MFNSKLSLLFSILTILASLSYFYLNLDAFDKLKSSSNTLYELPFDSKDLAIKLDGKCLGYLELDYKVETLVTISASIKDPISGNINAKMLSYVNVLGQLVRLNTSYLSSEGARKEYSLSGIKELTLSSNDPQFSKRVFSGPVNILIEDNKLKIMYEYLENSLKNRIEIIKRDQCA